MKYLFALRRPFKIPDGAVVSFQVLVVYGILEPGGDTCNDFDFCINM